MFDVDGTKVWLIYEVVKRLPSEARKKIVGAWGRLYYY